MLAYKRLRPRKGKVALTPGGLPGRDNCRPKKEEVTPMDPVSENEVERGLVEKAKRVLPGGTFGNFPSEVVIREGRGGRRWLGAVWGFGGVAALAAAGYYSNVLVGGLPAMGILLCASTFF